MGKKSKLLAGIVMATGLLDLYMANRVYIKKKGTVLRDMALSSIDAHRRGGKTDGATGDEGEIPIAYGPKKEAVPAEAPESADSAEGADSALTAAEAEGDGPEDGEQEDAGPEDGEPEDAGQEEAGPEDGEPEDVGLEDAGQEDVGPEGAGSDGDRPDLFAAETAGAAPKEQAESAHNNHLGKRRNDDTWFSAGRGNLKWYNKRRR